MYFFTDEVESSLTEEIHKRPMAWLKTSLQTIGSILQDNPSHYKMFGVYWWGVKYLLKHHNIGGKRAWYKGSYSDEIARLNADHGEDILNIQAAQNYASIVRPDNNWLDREESTPHFCEWEDGSVELYQLSDCDTGYQLDLFGNLELQAAKLERYLQSVTDFLPRTWRAKGDRAMQNGNIDLAIACYRRMVLLTGEGMDRTEAWLLLGMTFDQKKHFNKAIFCYMNLYEREKQHWLLGNIAASYSLAGKYRQAVDFYEQALRHMPDNPEFLAGLMSCRQKLIRRKAVYRQPHR